MKLVGHFKRRTLRACAFVAFTLLLFFATTSVSVMAADDTLYGITNNSPFTIYTIDPLTGVATPVSTLAFASASFARNPTNGLLYYTALNAVSGRYSVATWDPATSTNTTLASTINVYLPRLAFKSDGTLYGMDSNNNLYTLSTATGAILTTTVITCSGTCGGWTTGFGGDMAFSPTGTLYVAEGTNLYTVSGSTATLVGAMTGITNAPAGLAFGDNGALYASDTTAGNSKIYTLSTTTGAASLVGSSGAAVSDMASFPKYANLSITKAASGSFVAGANATYTLTVSNAGPQSASASIIVKDTLPTGMTFVSGTGTGWSCSASGQTVTCTNSSAMASGGSSSITLTVALASNVASSITNTANVDSPTFDSNTTNNSSSATTSITFPPDLTIAKSHTGNFTRGSTGVYTITATNSGPTATSGTVTVTDTLPTGFTYSSATGTGWSCSASGQTVTCTRSNALAAGANYPAISLTVGVAQNAASSITNTVSVSGGGEADTSNDSASDATTIVSSADLSLTNVVTSSGSGIGTNATFTVTLTNSGPSDATNIQVKDLLPSGLTYVSSTPGTGTYNSATGVWTVASLASGSSATLQLVGQINSLGAISTTAEVTASDQPDPDSTPNNHVATEDDQASASLSTSPPSITLCKTIQGQPCPPTSTPSLPPGSDISYVITFTNTGGSYASGFVITDPVPASTDFKVGSGTATLGTTGLTVVVTYSNDNGSTWTYTPASGGGGASAGYDRNVTHVRWTFSGNLSQNPPNNSGSVSLTVRIR